MALVLFNTMTGRKEPFAPREPGVVRMYVCGPTVYNYIHIGNGRAAVAFDVIRRWLQFRGFEVIYVHNYTDIDDKIIRVARETGETVRAIAERFIAAYEEDLAALGVLEPTHRPRVTEHIGPIVDLIRRLIERGVAYVRDGDVYFRVQKFPEYGKLSKQPIDRLLAGARVEIDAAKEHPLDFALWKRSEGDVAWDSPWGAGRPGWHIECSAMSMHYLGATLDIHGGGQDLIFPHHENEIAQSEAATGVTFARYWLHNGHVTVDEEKMSKSLGNVVLVRDVVREYGGRALRFFYLNTHYRQPLRFHREAIASARSAVERLDGAVAALNHALPGSVPGEAPAALLEALRAIEADFTAAMDDDFNTPEALTAMFALVRTAHAVAQDPGRTRGAVEAVLARFRRLDAVLGLLSAAEDVAPADVLALVAEREAARRARDFARADALRAEIRARGYAVEDTPEGPRLKRVSRS
ncbi:cysteine--tRNA ligase [Hydrogenibacillus schlegelii]|nr:cysteine--tRNA ligase [Hydrogenibacillus schlegelii]